jgi:hypothetical protein
MGTGAGGVPSYGDASPSTTGAWSTEPGSMPATEGVKALAAQMYPYFKWALDHPELGPILLKAASEGLDEARLYGVISGTEWWKKSTPASRSWDRILGEDPGQARQILMDKLGEVGRMAKTLGFDPGNERGWYLADQAIRFGWDEEDLQRALVAELKWDPQKGLTVGSFGSQAVRVRALASQWYVQMSDQTAWEWSKKILSGEMTEEGLTAYFRNQSISRFPHLRPYIEQGITPKQFFDPYAQAIGQILEVAPDSVDFLNDPRWSGVTSYADSKGTIRPMTISETMQYARSQPEFQQTRQAKQTSAEFANFLGQAFGAVA